LIQRLKIRYADLEYEYAELGQKYGSEHPSVVKQHARLESMQTKIGREVDHIVEASIMKYQLAKAHEQTLQDRVEALKAEVKSLNEKSVQYGLLKRDAESNRRLSDLLINRLKEASMTADLTSGNHIRVVDPAEVPTKAINIRPRLTMGLAGFMGLILGVGLVAFIGYLDNTLKTPDEAEELLGLPVVGVIETFRTRRGSRAGAAPLIALASPYSRSTEAFKTLRANLLLSYADPPRKVYLVSSSHPGDGKTTVAANLALVMAQAERRVLLIDADLRNPSLHQVFATQQNTGLSELLLTEAYGDLAEDQTGLTMIPAGDIPPNPSELLGSQRMERFLTYAREHYDTIIIDSPPRVGGERCAGAESSGGWHSFRPPLRRHAVRSCPACDCAISGRER
jgi:hypothetical protein